MNSLVESAKSDDVPDIVWIVLEQAYKFHASGRIDDQTYQEQLERLEREELQPRGLSLQVEVRSDGSMCFSVRRATSGEVCRELAFRPASGEETSPAGKGKAPPSSPFFPPGPGARIQPA